MNGKPSSQKTDTLGRYDRVRSTQNPQPGCLPSSSQVMNHFCRGIPKGALKMMESLLGGLLESWIVGGVVPRYVVPGSYCSTKNHPQWYCWWQPEIRDQLTSWWKVHIPIVYTGFSSIQKVVGLGISKPSTVVSCDSMTFPNSNPSLSATPPLPPRVETSTVTMLQRLEDIMNLENYKPQDQIIWCLLNCQGEIF